MSTYVFVAVGGGSLGLLLGGALTQSIDWHWIFFINVPVGLAAALLGRALIRPYPGLGLSGGVDVLGSILITAAVMLGIYAIVEAPTAGWASEQTLGLVTTAGALLAGFAVLQTRLANPILPPRILRVSGLLSSSVVRSLTMTGMYSAFFFGALFLNRVLGYGPFQTGIAFLPMTLMVGGLSLGVTARVVQRVGAQRTTILGLFGIIGGLALLMALEEQSSYFPRLFAAFALIGFGAGMSFMPLLSIALADVPSQDAGLASGLVNVSMQLSAALGLAVLGSVSAGRTAVLVTAGVPPTPSLLAGFQLSFGIALGCVSVAVLLAQIILQPQRSVVPVAPVEPDLAEVGDWASREAA